MLENGFIHKAYYWREGRWWYCNYPSAASILTLSQKGLNHENPINS
jgi:hypothetical protein